jgi:hypothetical protein
MKPINKSSPAGNVIHWLAALGCIVWGVGMCRALNLESELTEGFSGHIVPFTSRLVVIVGPFGWLLFSLFSAVLIIRFRRSNLGSIFTIAFLSVAIAAECALLFSSVECPFENVRMSCEQSHWAIRLQKVAEK